ncbi:MAG: bifunctional 3,4-dihydroxy-2-butanone-4-phosphate synthase/GTP cyclohydrolase II [Thermodesulfobacteriota bacterium]
MPLATIEEALEDIGQGKMIILVDDEGRENEGDLTIAAEKVTPQAINFMARYGRGLICLALTPEKIEKLGLRMMVRDNQSPFQTAFTISIEARRGVTTGISAADRATTVLTAVDVDCKPTDLISPGHVFPLRARRGGVLVRTGQTEGSVDLARLAGLKPAAVICEVLNEDGTMARRPDLDVFSRQHGLKIVSIADLIAYRLKTERLVQRAAQTRLPTTYGEFTAIAYTNSVDSLEHIALVKGEISPDEPVLVRVHSECLTGDALGSLRCDCGDQLHAALTRINKEGKGVLLYIHQEGRGIGLINKLKAYELQDQGCDTVEANEALGFPADLRDYGIGAQILTDVGVRRMRLMTNNPKKMIGLEGYGLTVVERVPIEIPPKPENIDYMRTKCFKMGHTLTMFDQT